MAEAVAFGKRMFNVVLDGYLSLGIAMGAELGLFKTLCAFDVPVTAAEIADKAGCKERYVREWLGAMVAGSVVESHEEGEKFFLPLTRRPALLSPTIQEYSVFIPKLTISHSHLMQAFKKDGPSGVPYEVTAPLINMWQKDRPKTFSKQMPGVLSYVPGLVDKLSSGINVCDIGCGQGHLVTWFASTYPQSKIYGIDVDQVSVAMATKMLHEKGIKNAAVSVNDAANLPLDWSDKFDLVILYDVLHDLPHATKSCSEFYRVLNAGGQLLIVDINVHSDPGKNQGDPNAIMSFPFSLYHCMSTSLSVDGSEGLGTCAGVNKFVSLLNQGGFTHVLSHDLKVQNLAPGLVLLTAVKDGPVPSSI